MYYLENGKKVYSGDFKEGFFGMMDVTNDDKKWYKKWTSWLLIVLVVITIALIIYWIVNKNKKPSIGYTFY